MEAKIEITEQEIKEFKERWLEKQCSEYSKMDYWKKQSIENELLSEIRQKHQYGADLYLTLEFKTELRKTLQEQVNKLVEEEIINQKRNLKEFVKGYIFEKFESITAELLKEIIIALPQDFNLNQEE